MTDLLLQIEAEFAALLAPRAPKASPAEAHAEADILSAQVIALAREAGRG